MKPHQRAFHGFARPLLGVAAAISVATLASFAHADQFIGPISEEAANHRGPCGPDEGISGMMCTGRYCDNLYIYCESLSPGIIDNDAPTYNGTWADSLPGMPSDCGEDGIAIGVLCRDSYCGSVELLCKPLLRHFDAQGPVTCSTGLPYFSDEQPFCWLSGADGVGGSFLNALECTGNHCDNMYASSGIFGPTRGH